MLEFLPVILCLLVFFLVFADMFKICINWLVIQYAVNKGGRYSKTVGESIRADTTRDKVIETAGRLSVQLEPEDVQVTLTSVETKIVVRKAIRINPLTGVLKLAAGEGYGGDYEISLAEVIRNELLGDMF